MKKFLTVLCASMLCFCCLALAACGGGGASSSAASSASSSSSAAPADPAEKFIGDWKIAAAKMNGVTMVGDFTQLLGEDSSSISLSIKKDGTGSMEFAGDNADLTWTQKGDDAITVTVTPKTESDSIKTVDVAFKDNALEMEMKDDSFSGTLVFTADGTYPDAKEISADSAKAITSEDALVGTWKLTGVNMMGVSMYGSADDLAAAMGSVDDTSLTFEKGGAAKAFGEDGTWKVSSDGAVLTLSGTDIPVKAFGDDIVIDASAMLGGTTNILMMFSK